MTESTSDNRSVYRFRWIGYGLLIFAFIDSVQLFVPPEFTNPSWELQTIGALVERVPVPLLGLTLIFFGEFYDRTGIERLVLRILSWICLGLTILFLLMIPLGVMNTTRIDAGVEQQVNRQVEKRMSEFKQLEDKLNQSKPEEIKTLGTQLSNLGITVDAQNPEDLKAQIITRINRLRADVQGKAQAERSSQKIALFKNSLKWNLGALIAAALFFVVWKSTDWARKS